MKQNENQISLFELHPELDEEIKKLPSTDIYFDNQAETTELARHLDGVVHFNGSTGMYELDGMEFVSDVEAFEYINERNGIINEEL